MEIRSIQNTRIKNLLRLQSSRRQRQRTDVMLVEGLDEIRLAISAGHVPRTLVTAPALARDMLGEVPAEVVTVSRAVFEKLSYREHPDGWLAVFSTPQVSLEQLQLGHNPLLIAMEALEKPGNLGAILRTADAAAVDAVLVCDRRADIYSPNVVRASRGALFSVPIVEASSGEAIEFLRTRGVKVAAATPGAGIDYTHQDLRGPLALAIGTEDSGLTGAWLEQADVLVRIPMLGKVNSLNVSVAAALIIFEARRQRSS